MWKNEAGDHVLYFLRYEVSPPGTRAVRMHVHAMRMTAKTVEKLRLEPKK